MNIYNNTSEVVFDRLCNLNNDVLEYNQFREGLNQVKKDLNTKKKKVVFEKKDLRLLDRIDYYEKFMFRDKMDYLYGAGIFLIANAALLSGVNCLMFIVSLLIAPLLYFMLKENLKFQLNLEPLHIFVDKILTTPRLFFILPSLPIILMLFKLGVMATIVIAVLASITVFLMFFFKLKGYRQLINEYESVFDDVLYYTANKEEKLEFIEPAGYDYSVERKKFYMNQSSKEKLSRNVSEIVSVMSRRRRGRD